MTPPSLLAVLADVWEGALNGAIKGAIIGGCAGVLVWLGLLIARRLQKDKKDKDDKDRPSSE